MRGSSQSKGSGFKELQKVKSAFWKKPKKVVKLYEEEIKEPIDLTLIRSRLDTQFYTSKDAFEVDISKMCQNCRTFNGEDSAYGKCATVIEKFARSLLRRTLRNVSKSASR